MVCTPRIDGVVRRHIRRGPVDPGSTPAAIAATTPVTPDRAAPRRNARVLLAAAAVAVVLAGTTVALLGDSGGKENGARTDEARAESGSSEPGGVDDGSTPRATQQGDDKGRGSVEEAR
ncbi:hypothetical protein ABZ281_24810 [Streptomyces sp. NPDC006265]|uniref:hypothetical protein n=1 Tax=Streptomyces sp. NPDC006265 TaxID=3156740 RepID=UPI0033A45FDB